MPTFREVPLAGVAGPVTLVRVSDADTQVYRVPESRWVWRVRLLDVWAPELKPNSPRYEVAVAGRAYAAQLLTAAHRLTLFVPFPDVWTTLTQLFTFNRIVGVVFLDDDPQTLNAKLVAAGYASSQEHGSLGR